MRFKLKFKLKHDTGDAPLHIAAYRGHVEAAEILINQGSEVIIENNDGVTPLHTASLFGRTSVAKLLLENGAEVNARAIDNETPLDYALESVEAKYASVSGKRKIARILRAHGGTE